MLHLLVLSFPQLKCTQQYCTSSPTVWNGMEGLCYTVHKVWAYVQCFHYILNISVFTNVAILVYARPLAYGVNTQTLSIRCEHMCSVFIVYIFCAIWEFAQSWDYVAILRILRLHTIVVQSGDCAHVLHNLQIACSISGFCECSTQSRDCAEHIHVYGTFLFSSMLRLWCIQRLLDMMREKKWFSFTFDDIAQYFPWDSGTS